MISKAPGRPVLMVEFNELCPRLLQQFMQEGAIPNFKRLYESSLICTTDAEEPPPRLEPWVQWLTIHTGLTADEHGIHYLGDGSQVPQKSFAEVLSDAGVRVGVFGSMNTNYRNLNGYRIPDAWDFNGKVQPSELQPFFNLVAQQVQDSSKNEGLGLKGLVNFGLCLVKNGLTPATAISLVKQVASEVLTPALRWRRPSFLDRIQYDLFRRLNSRKKIEFATFFCNSTAHYQHYFWRNMRPEEFDFPPPATDHASLKDAIRYGYQSMDKIIGRMLRDYPQATIILCTALSQQPWKDTSKCTYRPKEFEGLLKLAQIPLDSVEVKPVMAEEFHLICRDEAHAREVGEKLLALKLTDRPLMRFSQEENSLLVACAINEAGAEEQTIIRTTDGFKQRFSDIFYMVHSMRSGRHHPDGVLWIRTGEHRVLPEKVPLINIAPTILNMFGVPQPEYMTGHPLMIEEQCALSS